jgi:hypothetical protein
MPESQVSNVLAHQAMKAIHNQEIWLLGSLVFCILPGGLFSFPAYLPLEWTQNHAKQFLLTLGITNIVLSVGHSPIK